MKLLNGDHVFNCLRSIPWLCKVGMQSLWDSRSTVLILCKTPVV